MTFLVFELANRLNMSSRYSGHTTRLSGDSADGMNLKIVQFVNDFASCRQRCDR